MTRIVLLAIAAAGILADGYVSGRWTNRWSTNTSLERAVTAVTHVPTQIGNWKAVPMELGARQAERAGFSGYWLRRYVSKDGAVVNVMLACGMPGPLSVHTPDVCYAGAGYAQADAPATYTTTVNGKHAEFNKATFVKPGALAPVKLRLFWSWRADNQWRVTHNPRVDFAGLPVIYKMYITHEMTGVDAQRDDAVCTDFLQALLPALDRTLNVRP